MQKLEALDAESRLIVALDMSDPTAAYEFCRRLALPRAIYKVGLELLFAGGIDLVRKLVKEGFSVFVDAKLLDIGNTVERATAQIADLGAAFLTLHAQDRATLDAAVRGRKDSTLRLLGVTVLTSVQPRDLNKQGIALSAADLVLLRASFIQEAGCDGIVASAREATPLKTKFGQTLAIITPGIRPASISEIAGDDQARTATPGEAISAGADYIVVGRPILRAADPAAAARSVIGEIAHSLRPSD